MSVLNDFATQTVLHVFEASWQAAVLAAVVVLLCLLLHDRLSARWRCALWLVVVARLLLLVTPASPVSLFNLVPACLVSSNARNAGDEAVGLSVVDLSTSAFVPRFADRDVSPRAQADAAGLPLPDGRPIAPSGQEAQWLRGEVPWALFAGVWLLGGLVLAARMAVRTVRLHSLINSCEPVDDAEVWRVFEETRRELGVRRRVSLLSSPQGVGPAVAGVFRPKLVLSASLLNQFSPDEFQLVFLHELSHIRRHDLVVQQLWMLAGILHWFNPVVWFSARRWQADRELACDEAVLASLDGHHQAAYGRAILHVMDSVSPFRPVPGAVGAVMSRDFLTRRIAMIARYRPLPRRWTFLAAGLLLLLVPVGLTNAVSQSENSADSKPTTAANRDSKLNAVQHAMRDISEGELAKWLDPSPWEDTGPKEKAAEEKKWLSQLSNDSEAAKTLAIYALTALRSKTAVQHLLKIAADQKETDDQVRWMAVRALGIIGDERAVPDLVHLTYHNNRETRLWAQISLVRLTGENFGRDVSAWRKWWMQQGRTPPISDQLVQWATSPQTIQALGNGADPKNFDELDRQLLVQAEKPTQPSKPSGSSPQIVSTSPADGDMVVDPATAELVVKFDRDMGQGMTWNSDGTKTPYLPGSKAFWRDRRTCVMPVQLEAGQSYKVGLNLFSPNYQAFQSSEGVRLPSTTIHFATRGTRKPGTSVEASVVGVRAAKAEPNDNAVTEGVGWKSFRVGATRDDLVKAYGEPDSNPGNPWLRWASQHHVDCILGKDGRAAEVRFNKGFDLPLTSGIRIGSAEKEVLSAYGKPDSVLQQSQAKMLVFRKRGVLMWIMDGKVFDFTVMKKR